MKNIFNRLIWNFLITLSVRFTFDYLVILLLQIWLSSAPVGANVKQQSFEIFVKYYLSIMYKVQRTVIFLFWFDKIVNGYFPFFC